MASTTESGSMESTPFTGQIDYRVIGSDSELAGQCEAWSACPALGLDTEFMRVSTYYPKVGLLQVTDGRDIVLVDPLQISDWSPLKALLENPGVIKILHSCSEDLLVFYAFTGLIPGPLFDTQIASSLLGEGLSLSYQNLVIQGFGIELPKSETRSDWMQRPLTPQQLDYAALDVAWLVETWQQQGEKLARLGRQNWITEECERQRRQYDTEFTGDFSDYYLNFKAAWQFSAQRLAALRMLAEWREQRARKRDRPRNWILKDTALYAIANSLCTSRAQLAAIEDVSDNFIRHEGDQVLELVAIARHLPEADCPAPLPKPLSPGGKSRLKAAQAKVEAIARELGLAPELLVRKKALMALIYAIKQQQQAGEGEPLRIPEELQGWRKPLVLDALLEVLV
jgi:ribonuclease D